MQLRRDGGSLRGGHRTFVGAGHDAGDVAAHTHAVAARGLTVLLSCHDDGITRQVADRYLLLRGGKAVAGPIGELPRDAATVPDTEDLLPWLG